MLNLINLLQKIKLYLKFLVKSTSVLKYCILVTICLTASNTFFAQYSVTNVTYEEAFASLKTNRDRLLGQRAFEVGYPSAAHLWQSMTPVQKGVFLTITDYLGRRSFLNKSYSQPRTDFDTMLNHVVKLYAINGSLFSGDCGGIENHRIYFKADESLMYNIRNIQFLPNWRPSTDLAGPHHPFTQSREGVSGMPRAQIHEWAYNYQATTLYRPGVFGINDPYIVEMDIDYNFLHHSNPECTYDGVSGRQRYQNFYYNYGLGGSAEYDYVPTSAPGGLQSIGALESVSSDFPAVVRGWSLSPGDPQASNTVFFSIDAPAENPTQLIAAVVADKQHSGVNQLGYPGNHGFELTLWSHLCDGLDHSIYAYGSYDGRLQPITLLNNSPLIFNCSYPPVVASRTRFDFNYDRRADLALVRNGNLWITNFSPNNTAETVQMGTVGDIPVAEDYNGDGKTDYAIFRPSDGNWVMRLYPDDYRIFQLGTSDDIPAPADYDGDGLADYAVFRPSNGTWYVQESRDGSRTLPFGMSGDIPVAADYDGDDRADYALFRPSNGTWYMLLSGTNYNFVYTQFGISEDKPVPADYDGDGKVDIAVFRPSQGNWHLLQSTAGGVSINFGASEDFPVAADYDGDGRSDIAVWRPSNAIWYINNSATGLVAIQFGATGDRPVAAPYTPQ